MGPISRETLGVCSCTAAMHSAALTAAGVLVLATVLTLVLLRGTDPTREPAEAEEATVS